MNEKLLKFFVFQTSVQLYCLCLFLKNRNQIMSFSEVSIALLLFLILTKHESDHVLSCSLLVPFSGPGQRDRGTPKVRFNV